MVGSITVISSSVSCCTVLLLLLFRTLALVNFLLKANSAPAIIIIRNVIPSIIIPPIAKLFALQIFHAQNEGFLLQGLFVPHL
jgi:hypothetical protein